MSSEGGKQPEDENNNNNGNSRRVGGGGSAAAAAAAAPPLNNNKSKRVLTLLAQQGHNMKKVLSAIPELGHNYEFMSSHAVKGETRKRRNRFSRPAGQTRLMHAAHIGDVARIKEFVKTFDAPIDTEDDEGMTALAWAASAGKLKAVQALVESGAEINRGRLLKTPLFCAVRGNHLVTARWLCDRGADVNRDRTTEQACNDATSPEILELLCERGADVTTSANFGTPLHCVAYNSKLRGGEKAEILLRHGAQIDAIFTGQTPLYIASYSKNVKVVRALCENGANTELRSSYGLTPLMVACAKRISDGTVTALCEFGADKEAVGAQGTPLLYLLGSIGQVAHISGDISDVLTELLKQDVNIEARLGAKSALDIAVETRIPEVVRLLCADAKRRRIELNTPMAVRRIKKQIENTREELESAENFGPSRGWNNFNEDNGRYSPNQVERLEKMLTELQQMLEVLEGGLSKNSRRETKRTKNSAGGGGGSRGSNSNWWRGSKRKTLRKNR